MTRDQLALFLELAPERHRLLFRFLAVTGVRISELVGLQWRHLHLDGSEPEARIRRAIVRGRIVNPKSKYGRREIALPLSLADELRAWRRHSEWPCGEDLVFPSQAGTPMKVENLRRRALAPAAGEAGVPWIGFHTFRHTRATLMFAAGANAVQVQRTLGHHSPAFTLSTYVHLLPEDRFPAVDLDAELGKGGNRVATSAAFGEVRPASEMPIPSGEPKAA